MAVTITDRRTTQTSAENTTGWTGAGFGTTTDRAEGANAVANSLNIAAGATYFTGTSRNLGTSPGTLVYVYAFNNALLDTWDSSPSPIGLLLGDGTDRISFDMAGSDRRVFNHLDGPTAWQCLVLDTAEAGNMNTAGNTFVESGSFAGLNFAAITQFGAYFETLSKALGGGYNVAVDIIRFGNDGIRITAGGSGTEGNFQEIAVADRSIATGAGHGILRAYTTIAFGVQGPLTFGESGAATTSRFIDSGVVVVYENRNIADDKYYFNVEGNAGATNVFELRNSTITTAGPFVSMAIGNNINTLVLTGNTFALGGNVSMPTDTAHTVSSNTFEGCGTIAPGLVDFDNNAISSCGQITAGGGTMLNLDVSGYEGTADTAALVYNIAADTDGILDGATFTKGTASTHAIQLGANTPTSIDFNDWTVSGYNAANAATDSVILNTSGKSITVNVIGGTGTFSYKDVGAGSATTIVSNPVTLSIEVLDIETGSPIQNARVLVEAAAGGGLTAGVDIIDGNTNASGLISDTRSYSVDQPITGRVRRATAGLGTLYRTAPVAGTIDSNNGLSITVQMIPDE